jgi:hypothetical protein
MIVEDITQNPKLFIICVTISSLNSDAAPVFSTGKISTIFIFNPLSYDRLHNQWLQPIASQYG